MGLQSLVYIPQFFYLIQKGKLARAISKIVDDVLLAGTDHNKRVFIDKVSRCTILARFYICLDPLNVLVSILNNDPTIKYHAMLTKNQAQLRRT